MTKHTNSNPFIEIATQEKKKLENEIRSKLRYCWQRSIAFAIVNKPTIQEVIDELADSFVECIPKSNSKRSEFRMITKDAFHALLGQLYTTKDISDITLENKFVDLAISKMQHLLI